LEKDYNITEERETKFRRVLAHRQPGLTIVLENIHDPHNISAILRSCDAVGIVEVYVINSINPKQKKLGKKSSASARKWVKVNYFDNAEECIKVLREKGFKIWATHLSADAVNLYTLNLTEPSALVFGNEKDGVSNEILPMCDGNFIIPMVGMIPSLNVSVACAVSLYEAYRQRAAAGLFDNMILTDSQADEFMTRWSARKMKS
jgi:tRNA (guanosine-2'-O-)-methyltransferase